MDADAYVIFSTDMEGKPAGIKMNAISPLTDFSFDFQDLDFKRIKCMYGYYFITSVILSFRISQRVLNIW
jgi:hypothetical protein